MMKRSHEKDGNHRFSALFRQHSGRFEPEPYDPETSYPVIRSSICTGEKVAGFKSRSDGSFTEVMLIRSPKDLQEFKERFHLDSVKTEY